jgi:hypothetical protein
VTPRACRSPRARFWPRPPETTLLAQYDQQYPGYGFAQHKGYPTPEHFAAMERHGVLAIHRRSFAPVRRALGLDSHSQLSNTTPVWGGTSPPA